jgi:hypothetical protein
MVCNCGRTLRFQGGLRRENAEYPVRKLCIAGAQDLGVAISCEKWSFCISVARRIILQVYELKHYLWL